MATIAPDLKDLIVDWALEQGYEARQVLEGVYVIIETNRMQLLVSGNSIYRNPFGVSLFPRHSGGNLPPEYFSSLGRIIESQECHPLPDPSSPDYFTILKSLIESRTWPQPRQL